MQDTSTTIRAEFTQEPPLVSAPTPPIGDLALIAEQCKSRPGEWCAIRPPLVPLRGMYSSRSNMVPDRNFLRRLRADVNSGRSREFGTGFIAVCRDVDNGEDPRVFVKFVGLTDATAHQVVAL